MKRLLAWVALITALTAGPAAAAPVYALFVGIDTYAYQNPPHNDAEIKGLSGSRADVQRMKEVLIGRYGLDPARVVELYDAQADRAGIAAALNRQIEAAARTPGATVLFYYSGHGGQVRDMTRTQATGQSSTVIPYDGRMPGVTNDILDVELKAIIDQATAWGVNVVTIFDSCNSATATRGLREMHVRGVGVPATPAPASGLPQPHRPAGPRSPEPGLRVHLAAAQDGEAAGESLYDGQWRGDFTEALAGVLLQQSGATYEEIARGVRAKLNAQGLPQHPHAEGALLTRFLGSDRDDLRLYTATKNGDGFAVLGGRVAGVTEGSIFEVFESPSAARQKRPLGKGRIVRADDLGAVLKLEATAGAAPARIYLREVSHDYGSRRVTLGIQAPPDEVGPLKSALGGLSFLDLNAAQPRYAVRKTGQNLRLVDAMGMPISRSFATTEALIGELRRLAKYDAVLALSEAKGGPDLTLTVTGDCVRGQPCPALPQSDGDVMLKHRQPFKVVVENPDSENGYFIYVFDLASGFVVQPLNVSAPVEDGETGEKLRPLGEFVVKDRLTARFDAPPADLTPAEQALLARNQRDNFLLIASDTPIPAEALTQDAGRTRGFSSPLQDLIAQAYSGTRAAIAPGGGRWSAKVVSVRVCPPQGAPEAWAPRNDICSRIQGP